MILLFGDEGNIRQTIRVASLSSGKRQDMTKDFRASLCAICVVDRRRDRRIFVNEGLRSAIRRDRGELRTFPMRLFHRTPEHLRRRLANVRRLTQAIFVGSGLAVGLFVVHAADSSATSVSTTTTTPTTSVGTGGATTTTSVGPAKAPKGSDTGTGTHSTATTSRRAVTTTTAPSRTASGGGSPTASTPTTVPARTPTTTTPTTAPPAAPPTTVYVPPTTVPVTTTTTCTTTPSGTVTCH